jgi:elongation factor Ts
MAISALQVKELREMTGAGMADCKKALEEAGGDMNEAIEVLRKRGAASAAKRADRSTNEGLVIAKTQEDGKAASMVEINCETDFVARNDEYVGFVNTVADVVLNNNPSSQEELLAVSIGDKTVGDYMNEILAKFSERVVINRFERIATDGYVMAYMHPGNKLGVLVEFSAAPESDAARGLMRDIAMQVAAMNPSFVNREQVDQPTLDKEKEIYVEQAMQEGKKEDIAQRIATGRLEKYYQDNCLIEQTFVKDSGKTVTEVLKEIGPDVKILRFMRFHLGDSTPSNN